MVTTSCPECGTTLDLEDPLQEGDWIICPQCQANLEVINLDPLELDWAYDEPLEDWVPCRYERCNGRW
jgi:alpha-aminoadipate carrier protein LysW